VPEEFDFVTPVAPLEVIQAAEDWDTPFTNCTEAVGIREGYWVAEKVHVFEDISAGGRHACGIVAGVEAIEVDTGNIARESGAAIEIDSKLGQQKTVRCWGDNAKEQVNPLGQV
jgi:hypothetical protein